MRAMLDEFRGVREGFGAGLSLSHQETLKVQTKIELILSAHGEEFLVLDLGSNIVTDLGRSDMAHLIAGDSVSNRKVSEVKFGDGGHNPSSPTQALVPTAADTDLYGDEVISKVTSFEFPDGANGTRVTFTATIAENEGNGSGAQPYSEVGLYDLDGRMLTHKCFGLITKSDAFAMSIRYTIAF